MQESEVELVASTSYEVTRKELIREANRKQRKRVSDNEQLRLARNAYQREWRKKHPEAVRESNRRYWDKKAWQRLAEKQRQREQEQANGTD